MWTRLQIAERASKEMRDGMYCNLGIGCPTLIATLDLNVDVKLHNENGQIGMGPWPYEDEVDPDIISPSKQTITEVAGASYFDASESFAMIRGGHIDISFIGGMQVSEKGDLANWSIPGQLIKGMGGAMDLATAAKRVIVLMPHLARGKPRLVRECTLPLTAAGSVDMVITDMGVFRIDDGFVCEELAYGVTREMVRENTDAEVRWA